MYLRCALTFCIYRTPRDNYSTISSFWHFIQTFKRDPGVESSNLVRQKWVPCSVTLWFSCTLLGYSVWSVPSRFVFNIQFFSLREDIVETGAQATSFRPFVPQAFAPVPSPTTYLACTFTRVNSSPGCLLFGENNYTTCNGRRGVDGSRSVARRSVCTKIHFSAAAAAVRGKII